jgi:uncharacterized protein (TIGR03067 family)
VRRSLVPLAILSLAFAPLPFPRPAKGGKAASDLKALQGEWVRVSCSLNGGPPAASGGEDTAVYDGARLARLHRGVASARWVVTLDPSKEPRRMDMEDAAAPGRKLLCIYRLDGDTLTCAFRNQVNAPERPTDFEPHALMGVEVFRRKSR